MSLSLFLIDMLQIHERDLEMDLCLAILKKILFSTGSRLKLILMSATMEKEKFQNYFASR
jgi:HrpA-like RNA helicase